MGTLIPDNLYLYYSNTYKRGHMKRPFKWQPHLNMGNEKNTFKNHFKDLAISCAINSMTMNTSGPEDQSMRQCPVLILCASWLCCNATRRPLPWQTLLSTERQLDPPFVKDFITTMKKQLPSKAPLYSLNFLPQIIQFCCTLWSKS